MARSFDLLFTALVITVGPVRSYTREVPPVLDPFRFLLLTLAGWTNQHQVQMTEYLREENRDPGSLVPSGVPDRSQHNRPHPRTRWHRTLARAEPKDDLERVSGPTLGVDRGLGFLYVEVWTRRGWQRFLVLFFLDLSTRQVEIAGIASTANGLWMGQIGRKVTDAVDGIFLGKRYLIHDRDPLFIAEFSHLLTGVGVKSVKLPPRSPNRNAQAERFVRSIKESCLDRLIRFGEQSLRTTIQNCLVQYHAERHHQGLGHRLLCPASSHVGNTGAIQRRERLGGLLQCYYRAAA